MLTSGKGCFRAADGRIALKSDSDLQSEPSMKHYDYSPVRIVKNLSLATLLSVTALPLYAVERITVDAQGSEQNSAVDSWELQNASMSADGSLIAFETKMALVDDDDNNTWDVYLHDKGAGTNTLISQGSLGNAGNAASENPGVSADGRYVAFVSYADNLVDGDDNGIKDIFIYDRDTGLTEQLTDYASFEENGGYPPLVTTSEKISLSADGRYVVFDSYANNLVADDENQISDVFVYDRDADTITRISPDDGGWSPNISADGRYVVYKSGKIHIYDLVVNETVDMGIVGDNPDLSADGRYIAFTSQTSEPLDEGGAYDQEVYVYDRESEVLERISDQATEADDYSILGNISADGRFVSFYSNADNLVAGDGNEKQDVFIHDRSKSITERFSVDSVAIEGNGHSLKPTVSADGSQVAFWSWADNLVDGDTNASLDLFVANVNFAPMITSEAEKTILENTTPVMTLTADDPDGDTVSFDVIGGDDKDLFSIYAGNQLQFNNLPSFSVPGDADSDNVYEVQVRAEDPAGKSAEKSLRITVTDNLYGPTITSDAKVSMPEFEQVALTLTATDPEGDAFSFKIIGGADQALFSVDENNRLYFIKAPYFYKPADADANNVYEVEVQAVDAKGKSTEKSYQTVLITVTDVPTFFEPDQFDFSFGDFGVNSTWLDPLNNIGNIPLGGVDQGIAVTSHAFDVKIQNTGDTVQDIIVNLQFSGHGEVLEADQRCLGNTQSGAYQCGLDELPSGGTLFQFQLQNKNNVSAYGEIQPKQKVAEDADERSKANQPVNGDQSESTETDSSSNNLGGGGSTGWLSLMLMIFVQRLRQGRIFKH